MSSFSYPGGQPPTPTKTPTSATFGPPPLQTPKSESSFFDPRVTWNTADPCGSSPPILKTPQHNHTVTTPKKRASTSSNQNRPPCSEDLETELASHVHHLSPNPGLELPPVEPARQLSSSPNPSSTKRACLNREQLSITPTKFGPILKDTSTMRSAGSMQTPPPTSTSASKRKAQQAQVAKLVKESASGTRRLSSPNFTQSGFPEQSNEFLQASPQLFPNLQFSPDVFGFPSAGPATAPVYPQHKLFWDPDTSMGTMDMDFSGGNLDLFGPAPSLDVNPFVSQQSVSQSIPATGTFHVGSHPQGLLAQDYVADLFPATSSGPQTSSHASSKIRGCSRKISAKAMAHANAVDPTLLLSSSSRNSNPPPKSSIPRSENPRDVRQPYLHQTQESRREKELERGRRAKSKQTLDMTISAESVEHNSTSNQDDRPGMKRRSTDTAATTRSSHRKKPSQVSLLEPSKQANKAFPAPVHKRSSPIKSQNPDTQVTTFEAPTSHQRTSVTFTIDDYGRARTETKLTTEGSESGTDLEAKIDVNGTWEDSDSETSEDADAAIATSFHSSFTFPTSKQPRLARFATDSISHSKKSSYSSTYDSSRSEYNLAGSGLAPQLRSSSLYAFSGHNVPSMQKTHGAGSLSSGTISDVCPGVADGPESEAETVVDSDKASGDAQHALKKVMKDRAKKKKRTSNNLVSGSSSRGQPHNDVHSPTKHQTHSSSRYHPFVTTPTQGQDFSRYGDGFNISPTTITDPDLATPSTDRGSSVGDSTRCVCHSSDSGGHLMIQW
ncbi:MAG: hypothetical protein M1830_004591 [Pleopsidium flavum]|nr:MAG: hypothetical protein M1830_004591 [Pleopsidium flavum]